MKSLQQHFNESLVNEAYKTQFKPADWENVLKQLNPPYTDLYSQLGNLENYISRGKEAYDSWIYEMIEDGVQDTPENREIMKDIFQWTVDNYEFKEYDCEADSWELQNFLRRTKTGNTIWCVDLDDGIIGFMKPKKNLSGENKKFGELLYKFGENPTTSKQVMSMVLPIIAGGGRRRID